ncbi:unnamed protein product [Chrysoparadoxa australica]
MLPGITPVALPGGAAVKQRPGPAPGLVPVPGLGPVKGVVPIKKKTFKKTPKQRCWMFEVAHSPDKQLSLSEVTVGLKDRYSTVIRVDLTVPPTNDTNKDSSRAYSSVRVHFKGPQPAQGPAQLLCQLYHGGGDVSVSVRAVPVELPRGRRKISDIKGGGYGMKGVDDSDEDEEEEFHSAPIPQPPRSKKRKIPKAPPAVKVVKVAKEEEDYETRGEDTVADEPDKFHSVNISQSQRGKRKTSGIRGEDHDMQRFDDYEDDEDDEDEEFREASIAQSQRVKRKEADDDEEYQEDTNSQASFSSTSSNSSGWPKPSGTKRTGPSSTKAAGPVYAPPAAKPKRGRPPKTRGRPPGSTRGGRTASSAPPAAAKPKAKRGRPPKNRGRPPAASKPRGRPPSLSRRSYEDKKRPYYEKNTLQQDPSETECVIM